MKRLHWLGSTREDIKDFPEDVRADIGFALYMAECGDKAYYAYPLVGFGGSKVMEVVSDDDGDTFCGIYTACFKEAIYVLHAFKKKSKRGIETPKHDMNLIKERFKRAQKHYKENYETKKGKEASNG